MKSKMCKGCRCYWPKGSTAFPYDVCNFKFLSAPIQKLSECPNGKPIYRVPKDEECIALAKMQFYHHQQMIEMEKHLD